MNLFAGAFTQILASGAPVNFVGNFNAQVDIDFGARTIGGPNSQINVDTTGANGTINAFTEIIQFSYANDVGLAQGTFEPGELSNQFFLGTSGSLNNSDGIIANTGTLNVNYNDPVNQNEGTGSATSEPRK